VVLKNLLNLFAQLIPPWLDGIGRLYWVGQHNEARLDFTLIFILLAVIFFIGFNVVALPLEVSHGKDSHSSSVN
jgi:hypothetical protein